MARSPVTRAPAANSEAASSTDVHSVVSPSTGKERSSPASASAWARPVSPASVRMSPTSAWMMVPDTPGRVDAAWSTSSTPNAMLPIRSSYRNRARRADAANLRPVLTCPSSRNSRCFSPACVAAARRLPDSSP